ncbi:GntR family transcriptional regulator [Achromobacter sp. HZ01]|jgi:DNA-binding GntR family transcriptional regulator|uniref:GntR family transcriptional regulator n=1 Tax=Achromobacter pulmonis TaxID=1389932 RepID=A0A2N8KH18_9BURK|nr:MULTISPECIES: GntR family transcriptional regulator [Achromobacter]MBO9329999.1 FCD domain-containing protein [Achromobacter xylosoxidans]PND32739.1 GntR family transcriptional regulator [Achromobacter pulmonis]RAP62964.1 GntR family transcriptional regulator [Achromobacter sp. HZ01]
MSHPTGGEPARAATQQRTQASLLTDTVLDDIIAGRLLPGAKLKLKELAERYDTGVNPLREALSRLATSGFVNAEDQRGFSVAKTSREELLDITQTRQRIECDALRASIAHGDIEWEGRVMAALHRLKRQSMMAASGVGLDPQWEAEHDAFHEALLSACPSKWSLRFSLILRDQTSRYRNLSVMGQNEAGARDVHAEHEAIAKAALAKNADLACALLAEHLRITTALVLEHSRFGRGAA